METTKVTTKGSQKYKIVPLKFSYYKIVNITYDKDFNQGRIVKKEELLNFFNVKFLKGV